MSDFERGVREAMKIAALIALAVIFGPWFLLSVAAWLFQPLTGSWGNWPTYIGAAWSVLLILVLAWWFTRK